MPKRQKRQERTKPIWNENKLGQRSDFAPETKRNVRDLKLHGTPCRYKQLSAPSKVMSLALFMKAYRSEQSSLQIATKTNDQGEAIHGPS